MQYRTFAGKKTAAIVLGGGSFGFPLSEEQSFEFMDAYVALGGNFIDTARIYGDLFHGRQGLSEQAIGRWMAARHNRESITLSTKGGHPPLQDMRAGRLGRADLESDLSESLDALQTDYADVYFLHRDDVSRPVGDILETLNRFVADGKVRVLGASNWTAARIAEANDYAAAHGMTGFGADQPQFSLARQALVEDPTLVQMDDELHAFHARTGMPCLCFSSIAKGFFTKLQQVGEAGLPDKAKRRFLTAENLAVYERLLALSRETGHSVHALSIAYLTSQPFDTYPICGSSRLEQVLALKGAGDVRLTAEQVDFLRGFNEPA